MVSGQDQILCEWKTISLELEWSILLRNRILLSIRWRLNQYIVLLKRNLKSKYRSNEPSNLMLLTERNDIDILQSSWHNSSWLLFSNQCSRVNYTLYYPKNFDLLSFKVQLAEAYQVWDRGGWSHGNAGIPLHVQYQVQSQLPRASPSTLAVYSTSTFVMYRLKEAQSLSP